MTIVTTLIDTLSGLKDVATIVIVVVSLIQIMLWTYYFLRQLGARCLEIEQIIQGYFNGTLTTLTCCVVTPTIGSTTLVEIVGATSSSFFLLWQVSLTWLVLPQFEQVSGYLTIM
jgi:hypothetical protein